MAKAASSKTVSPLAPAAFPAMPPVDGVVLGVGEAGIKYKNRADIMLAHFGAGTHVAGVFTRSSVPGAPVKWCREALKKSGGQASVLVVKAGNANVFTAEAGLEACRAIAKAAAEAAGGCAVDEVLLSATGVIGEPLPYEKVVAVLPDISLDAGGWADAASAIMTTDTFAKGATITTSIAGTPVNINGIAKGSGMIEPNMATMLSYIATDADLPVGILDELLKEAVEESFNAITVDGDTSTSDTVLLFATGRAGHDKVSDIQDPALGDFKAALGELCRDLAQQIVRDGEGATKFITIKVVGAADDATAKRVAKSIANSPLVKTAIAGEDANWGRVVMAVGKTGAAVNESLLEVIFGGQPVTENGRVRAGYDESVLDQHLKGSEIDLEVRLGAGTGRAEVWTCDLTHGYIDINADYRS